MPKLQRLAKTNFPSLIFFIYFGALVVPECMQLHWNGALCRSSAVDTMKGESADMASKIRKTGGPATCNMESNSQLLAMEQDVEYRVHQDRYKCIQLAFRGREPTVDYIDYRYGTWGQTKNTAKSRRSCQRKEFAPKKFLNN